MTRINSSAGVVSVDVLTTDGAVSNNGAVVAGEDYQAADLTLTFLDGETSQTLTITIMMIPIMKVMKALMSACLI